MTKIEGIIGGLLALLVLVAAVYLILPINPPIRTDPLPAPPTSELTVADCKELGYRAGEAKIGSAEYRTGWNYCGYYLGEPGAEAWLTGWERGQLICQCFDGGYKLAGSGASVMSAQYRSGNEQCRSRLEDKGADAWTAGWNKRVSAEAHKANCSEYLRGYGR
jgi:hypothetical protein